MKNMKARKLKRNKIKQGRTRDIVGEGNEGL
jgi:hypothetical protein